MNWSRRLTLYSGLISALVLLELPFAKGEFIVQIGTAAQISGSGLSFARGSTGNEIQIWGMSDAGGTDLALYGLAFDIGSVAGSPPSPNGAGYNAGFSNFTADFTGGFITGAGTTTDFDQSNPDFDNYDFYTTGFIDSFSGLGLTANTPVKLFTLKFDIDGATATGDYSFVFRDDALLTGFDANQLEGMGLAPDQISGGGLVKFTVTAVPEPASIALVGIGMAGFAGVRRWRKRKVAAPVAC